MRNNFAFFGAHRLRPAALLSAFTLVLLIAGCGSGQPTTTTTSGLMNRAFITNTYSGNLQIVDTQNDMTAFTQQTVNSAGEIIPGSPVAIAVATTVNQEYESPNHATTAVYDPGTLAIYYVTNSNETVAGNSAATSAVSMAVFSPDSTTLFASEPTLTVAGAQRLGGIQAFSVSTFAVTATYGVPSVRYVAISPSGQYLMAFANNSDSLWLINLQASTVTPMEIPGFARPINAFFSSDSNTAYVLNCGPECGSSGAASVAFFNIPSQTITATVPVGGASVGLLNNTTLYVAGSPVPPGTTSTYDAVDVGSMSRITPNSVAIGDGFHTTMALATNNKLYIGANQCSNTTTGCLSVVNVTSNTADSPLPPRGAITSLLAVKNRDVVYSVEGGLLDIYDTDNDTLESTLLTFTGALYGIVQVDP